MGAAAAPVPASAAYGPPFLASSAFSVNNGEDTPSFRVRLRSRRWSVAVAARGGGGGWRCRIRRRRPPGTRWEERWGQNGFLGGGLQVTRLLNSHHRTELNQITIK
jgi:hypothetical protein